MYKFDIFFPILLSNFGIKLFMLMVKKSQLCSFPVSTCVLEQAEHLNSQVIVTTGIPSFTSFTGKFSAHLGLLPLL